MSHDVSKKSKSHLSSIKLAYLAEETRLHKIDAISSIESEPVAIVGMACRLPGNIRDPEKFWNILIDGVNVVTEIPENRINIQNVYSADPSQPGKTYSKWMGTLSLSEIENFDCEFFGISPREARQMDPQQRLLMKVSYEAIEDAGFNTKKLVGSKTGVFIGACGSDYHKIQAKSLNEIDAYSNSGSQCSLASGRLSYFYGLEGPSITIDTACSSSLVALHYARQSLITRESSMALVGGVAINLMPEMTVGFAKAKMLSPNGKCNSFDENANGYVRSEGCIVLMLKRLSDAVADGDRIHAVIRGTSVNNDGKSTGLTVPSESAQRDLILESLRVSCVDPTQVSYIEAHGPGTPVGDPIEVSALNSVYGINRENDNKLYIGSVKSNIGHLEPVSGAAGLLKVILSMKHGQIPKNLHLQKLNPKIKIDSDKVKIVVQHTAWNPVQNRKLAAINSFAFSGTNAHAILEEAPPADVIVQSNKLPYFMIVLSARNNKSLEALASQYVLHLEKNPDQNFSDFCYSTMSSRTAFTLRKVFLGNNRTEILEQLKNFGLNTSNVTKVSLKAPVFHLQISEFISYNFGQLFYLNSPKFKEIISDCDKFLSNFDSLSIKQYFEGSPIDSAKVENVFKFCAGYAFVKTLQAWGVTPKYISAKGISSELSAGVAVGIISLEDACNRLMIDQSLTPHEVSFQSKQSKMTYISEANFVNFAQEELTKISLGTSDSDKVIELFAHLQTDFWISASKSLSDLYLVGAEIDWKMVYEKYDLRRVDLPHYQFSEQRYWIDLPQTIVQASNPSVQMSTVINDHPFFRKFPVFQNGNNEFSMHIDEFSYLKDHLIQGKLIFPGAGFFEFVHGVAKQIDKNLNWDLKDIILMQPMIINSADFTVKMRVTLNQMGQDSYKVEIFSFHKESWLKHLDGKFSARSKSHAQPPTPWFNFNDFSKQGIRQLTRDQLYQTVNDFGYNLGPAFQGVQDYWKLGEYVGAKVKITDAYQTECKDYWLQPALLDSCLQSAWAVILDMMTSGSTYIPFYVEEIKIYSRAGYATHVIGKLTEAGDKSSFTGNYQILNEENIVIAEINGITIRKIKTEVVSTSFGKHLFTEKWKLLQRPVTNLNLDPSVHWIIFSDGTGIGESLAKEFQQRKISFSYVTNSLKTLVKGNQYTLNFDNVESVQSMLLDVKSSNEGKKLSIVYLWGLDAKNPYDVEADEFENGLKKSCRGALHLIQAITNDSQIKLYNFKVVTRGAQPVSDLETLHLGQAPLIGMCRTVELENPELLVSLIDLDPSPFASNVSDLFNELYIRSPEKEVAIRNQVFFGRRIESLPIPVKSGKQIDGLHTYLITGGLGSLGLAAAEWLSKKGARNIVLISRSIPSADTMSEVQKLGNLGVNIKIKSVDIGNLQALVGVLNEIKATMPPIKGIFHAAGIVKSAPVFALKWKDFEDGFNAKIFGTWNLFRALSMEKLDFFCLFSSIASLMGNAGQASYSASNAFLDSISGYMRTHGIPAVTINLGGVKYKGMASDVRIQEYLTKMGAPPISLQVLQEAWENMMNFSDHQVGVFQAEWKVWAERHKKSKVQTLLEAFVDQSNFDLQSDVSTNKIIPLHSQPTAHASAINFKESYNLPKPVVVAVPVIAVSNAKQNSKDIQSKIQKFVADTMGFQSIDAIDPSGKLNEMGLDSLMFVELRSKLSAEFGSSIPASQIFNYPTIESIVGFYMGQQENASLPVAASDVRAPVQVQKIIKHQNSPIVSPVLQSSVTSAHSEIAFPSALTKQSLSRNEIQGKIQKFVADTMGFQSIDAIDPAGKLNEMGLDSLMFVELRSKLSAEFGNSIPASQIFNYPTIDSIVDYYVAYSSNKVA